MSLRAMQGLAIVALMALPGMARAQSDLDHITAQVIVIGAVDVTGTADLDFGTVLTGSGPIGSSSVPTAGTWSVTLPTEQGNGVQISFSLPNVLQNAGGTATIPIAFGTQSAALHDGAIVSVFDPATGATAVPGGLPSSFTVSLGEDFLADGSGNVQISVGSVPPDTYTGVITMTVAIL